MSTHAAGTFEIESWDEQPYEEQDGTRLTRTRLTKTFSGDVEGESAAELLMAYGSEEGSAAYVGLERVTGSEAQELATRCLGLPSVAEVRAAIAEFTADE